MVYFYKVGCSLFKRFIYISVILVAISALLLAIPFTRDFFLKQSIEYFLSTSDVKIKIGSLSATPYKIEAKDTKIISYGNLLSNVETIRLDYDLDKFLRNQESNIVLTFMDEAKILGRDATISAKISYNGKFYGPGKAALNIEKIDSAVFGDLGLGIFNGFCDVDLGLGSTKVSNCKITDGNAYLEIDAKIDANKKGDLEGLYIKGSTNNLPVDLHRSFHDAMSHNDTVQYIYDNISGATILKGFWEINLDKEFFSTLKMRPEYIQGNFKLDNIRLAYDPDFPPLEKIKTELEIKGSLLDFKILSAYTGKTLLHNGSVRIYWGVDGDIEVMVDADAKGPALDLTSFIPKEQIDSLKEESIDLSKIKGDAVSKVHIIVPFPEEKKNHYDITTKISNVSLNLFEDSVSITNSNLNGIFDGEKVKIQGSALINNFKSEISVTQHLLPGLEYDTEVSSKTTLAPFGMDSTHSAFYEVRSGESILDFVYKKKGEKVFLSAKSNLKDLEFVFGKLGVYKAPGEKAYLDINNEGAEGLNPVNIKIYGDNGLRINGSAELSAKLSKITFGKIRSNETDIRADISAAPNDVNVKIRGNALDLSHSNMMQFMTKNVDKTATNLDIKINKIFLKNNVTLNDFLMKVNCDKLRCNKGLLLSKLMDKSTFTMDLSKRDNYELWKIKTDDAGSLFAGEIGRAHV